MNTPWGAQQAEQKQAESHFNWNTGNAVEVKPETLPASTVITETALDRFDIQAAALAEINKYLSLKVDINLPATVHAVKDARSNVRNLRIKVQRREKEINDDLNDQKKRLKKDVSDVTGPIKHVEEYLTGELKKYDDHQAKLKAEEEAREQKRLAAIKNEMDVLSKHCESALVPGLSADQIKERLISLESIKIDQDVFQERYQDACSILNHGISMAWDKQIEVEKDERAEADRRIQEAKLKAQAEVNDQTAWFNQAFGFSATPDMMDEGLKHLFSMAPNMNIAALVDLQKRQAVEIIDKVRMDFNSAYDEAYINVGIDSIDFCTACDDAHKEKDTRLDFEERQEQIRTEQVAGRLGSEAKTDDLIREHGLKLFMARERLSDFNAVVEKNAGKLCVFVAGHDEQPVKIFGVNDSVGPVIVSIQAVLNAEITRLE